MILYLFLLGLTTTAQERILAQKKLLQPWVGVGKTDKSREEIGALGNSSVINEIGGAFMSIKYIRWNNWEYSVFVPMAS